GPQRLPDQNKPLTSQPPLPEAGRGGETRHAILPPLPLASENRSAGYRGRPTAENRSRLWNP
ncbi:MAG: hypothetical protein ACK57P_02710, partial [Planctomycetota bacterium]